MCRQKAPWPRASRACRTLRHGLHICALGSSRRTHTFARAQFMQLIEDLFRKLICLIKRMVRPLRVPAAL